MGTTRRDYMVWLEEGYFEHASIRGVEMNVVEEADCLVQEFFGELKTNVGEIKGVGLELYGSDLKRYLGEPLNMQTELEIEECIGNCAAKYPEILKCEVLSISEQETGIVKIEIKLKTIYGVVLKVLEMGRGC